MLRTICVLASLLVILHFAVAHAQGRRVVVVDFEGGKPARALQTEVRTILRASKLEIVNDAELKLAFDTPAADQTFVAQKNGALGVVMGSLARNRRRIYVLSVALVVDGKRTTTALALGRRPVLTRPLKVKLKKQLTTLIAPLNNKADDEEFVLAGDPRAAGASAGEPGTGATTSGTGATGSGTGATGSGTGATGSGTGATTSGTGATKGPATTGAPPDPTDALPPWVDGVAYRDADDMVALRVRVPKSSLSVAHVLTLEMRPDAAGAFVKALEVLVNRSVVAPGGAGGPDGAAGLPSWVDGLAYRDTSGDVIMLRVRVPKSPLTAAQKMVLEMTPAAGSALLKALHKVLDRSVPEVETPKPDTPPVTTAKPDKPKKKPYRNFAPIRAPNSSNRVYFRPYWDSRKLLGLEGLIRVTTPLYFTLVGRTTVRFFNSGMTPSGDDNPEIFSFSSIYGPSIFGFGPVFHIGNPLGTGGDALRLGIHNTFLWKFSPRANLFFLTLFLPYDFTRPSGMGLSSITATVGPMRAELVTAYVWQSLKTIPDLDPKPTYLRPFFGIFLWKNLGVYAQYEYNQGDMTPSMRKGLRLGFEMQARF